MSNALKYALIKIAGRFGLNWMCNKLGNIDATIAPRMLQQISYAQHGEDIILWSIFKRCNPHRFYVDVGACHPYRYSNTYFFYKMNWRGINIEATPGSMQIFDTERPCDINIEAAIASKESFLNFYIFENPLLNSFDEELVHARIQNGRVVIAEKRILPRTLEEVLTEYLPAGQNIDFLSVDVEGFELDVLMSNNWQKFRPDYILVECRNLDISRAYENETHCFLLSQGYRLYAKTVLTLIYQEESVSFFEDSTVASYH